MSRFHLDPQFEETTLWPDFHQVFITLLRVHLAAALEPHYAAFTEERVYIAAEPPPSYYRADVAVTAPEQPAPTRVGTQSVATTKPVIGTVPIPDRVVQRFVAVRTPDDELVTVIELLSPTNKRPGHEGLKSYHKKRNQLLETSVHLVEIDLLVKGERPPLAGKWPSGERVVVVARGERRPEVELYPFGVDDPLPVIGLPLRAPDADHPLNLQAILEETWRQGRYERPFQRIKDATSD